MLLYSESHGNDQGNDRGNGQLTVVFLHGLLGSGRDWQSVVDHLAPRHSCLTVDLPGHGQSHQQLVDDFEQTAASLQATLCHRGVTDYILVGYSLGARVAMYHACCYLPSSVCASNSATDSAISSSVPSEMGSAASSPRLVGMVLEGGHFGLPEGERAARFAHDSRWAQRLTQEPLTAVLSDWYQQPVFSSLTAEQRQQLVQKRSANQGAAVAHMLLATSLAKQPFLLPPLTERYPSVHYLCGEKDTKFTDLATRSGLTVSVIAEAGHNVHVEQPQAFAKAVEHYLCHMM
ncbi:2-succinyl-6-hydroxy-2,4-cyclohexadiene-1-carboxylate synthase [Photobacterium japonica]|uniref:2-succinyl-6-hydroxy-2, 4-cyclohexadiene-1-carboxylate synthase n=1 Tax=Photobacterium japonica TaxID=2910235 RepID=UPI003D0FDEE3